MKTQIHNLERVAQKNKGATERLEAQSRLSDLIIYGIEGDKNESWGASEDKFRHYISDELKVPEYNIRTERVHRLNTKLFTSLNYCQLLILPRSRKYIKCVQRKP